METPIERSPHRLAIESMFKIVDKFSADIPFTLNDAQQQLDAAWRPRMLIPKARQRGVSAYVLARFTIDCLVQPNTHAVVISHESDATQRLLQRVHYYLENIRGPKPVVKMNKNEVIFEKTNSTMFIGTAGSRKFGRGDTITRLHASEAAYWPDPKELTAGLFQSVPKRGGQIVVESTGNGCGNWYHSMCQRASRGDSTFSLHFISWLDCDEYRFDCSDDESEAVLSNLHEEWGETRLVEEFKATPGQILFWRSVLEELDFDTQRALQEYPATLTDCFQASGASIFPNSKFIHSSDWYRVDYTLHRLRDHPQPHLHYVLGADVSAGVGSDYSVAEVFCLETDEQVAEFSSNRVAPDIFAYKLADLGRMFNEAYLGVENNNHGLVTVSILPEIYPNYKIYRTKSSTTAPRSSIARLVDLGFRTTSRSKPLMIGELRKALASGLIIHSETLSAELSSFVEHEDGSLGAQSGSHDDCVVASAIAMYVRSKAALALVHTPSSASSSKGEGQFDEFFSKLAGNRSPYPFPAEQWETWN